MTQNTDIEIKLMIRRVRETELKLWWIADQLGYAKSTVCRWSSGRSVPKLENAKRVIQFLDCEESI